MKVTIRKGDKHVVNKDFQAKAWIEGKVRQVHIDAKFHVLPDERKNELMKSLTHIDTNSIDVLRECCADLSIRDVDFVDGNDQPYTDPLDRVEVVLAQGVSDKITEVWIETFGSLNRKKDSRRKN